MKRTRQSSIFWLRATLWLVVFGLLFTAVMACGAEQPLEKRKRSLIFNGENWDFLPLFDNNATYKVGARYGRAVGRFEGCSAFLIDDEYFTTARHCRPSSTTGRTIRFGQYGVSPGNIDRGLQDARNRLQDIGFPATFVNNMSTHDLQTWNHCRLVSSEFPGTQKRDIDHWKCLPKSFSVPLSVTIKFTQNAAVQQRSRSYSFQLLPGHVYGHYNVRPGHRNEGYKLYGVSNNYKSSQPSTQRSVLLSPAGFITDRSNGYMLEGQWHRNGFEYIGTDMVAGSSGAPVIGRYDHRVIGVHSRGSHSHGSRTSYGTGLIDRQVHYNIGAYMSNHVLQYNESTPKKYPISATITSTTNWIGGHGGTLRDLRCPTGFLAAGIVHSNSPRRYVGNFGLICVPFWDSVIENQLDRAVVKAGGSHDTVRGSIQKDFNSFTKENLTIEGNDHPFAMCPQGYQLRGVEMRKDTNRNLFKGIKRIECARFEGIYTGHGVKVATYHRFTRERKIWNYEGTVQSSVCPVGQVVMGIRIRSGDLTDGFAFHCKSVYRPAVPGL